MQFTSLRSHHIPSAHPPSFPSPSPHPSPQHCKKVGGGIAEVLHEGERLCLWNLFSGDQSNEQVDLTRVGYQHCLHTLMVATLEGREGKRRRVRRGRTILADEATVAATWAHSSRGDTPSLSGTTLAPRSSSSRTHFSCPCLAERGRIKKKKRVP